MLFEIGDILILNENKNNEGRFWIYDYTPRCVLARNNYGNNIMIEVSTLHEMLKLNQARIIRQPKNQYAIMGREQITIEEVMGGK